MKKFFIRLTHWEYWPLAFFQFPTSIYFAWLMLKARSFFFFTASNPKIDFGGMIGEKKSEIYPQIPDKYLPKTILIAKGQQQQASREAEKIGFPIIVKPDIGERGIWVQKINDYEELKSYVEHCPADFLIQELVDYPIELGVFYVKYPSAKKGKVTSIVRKKLLTVEGDGVSTVMELLLRNTRAQLMGNMESEFIKKNKNVVPPKGEKILIEPIGNHSRGTMFLNDTKEIDEVLNEAFDRLAQQIPEFYFGRFDLKCRSYEALKKLEDFKIMELNGAGAEPAHIYHPNFSLFKAYQTVFWHLRTLLEISIENRKKGYPYCSFKDGVKKHKAHKKHIQMLKTIAKKTTI